MPDHDHPLSRTGLPRINTMAGSLEPRRQRRTSESGLTDDIEKPAQLVWSRSAKRTELPQASRSSTTMNARAGDGLMA